MLMIVTPLPIDSSALMPMPWQCHCPASTPPLPPTSTIAHCNCATIIHSHHVDVLPLLPIATAATAIHSNCHATHHDCMALPFCSPRLVVSSPLNAATIAHCNCATIPLSIALLLPKPIAIAPLSSTLIALMSHHCHPSPPPPPSFMAILMPHITIAPPSQCPLCCRHCCLLQLYHCHCCLPSCFCLSITAHCHQDCNTIPPSIVQLPLLPVAIGPQSPSPIALLSCRLCSSPPPKVIAIAVPHTVC